MIARRPIAGLLLVVTVLAIVLAPAGVDAADGPFVLGSGAASATVTKARLFYAGYSLQVPLGLSATTYENRQSRALGSAYDLSAALALAKVKVPEVSPVSIDSNSGDAATTRDLGAGPVLGRVALSAKTVPAATSEVRLADLDLPGLLRVEGGHARSSSAIVDGTERRAQASVDVGTVSLLDGVVVLEGLHWEAAQRSGSAERSDAGFTLGTLRVGGAPIASDLHDLGPVLDAINAALAPTGLALTAPNVVHRDNGAIEVTALEVGILNSPLGAQALAPLIAGLRPVLAPVYEALTSIDTTLGLASLVADLGLGVADGSGGVALSIGGATAITDDTVFADPLSGLVPVAPSSPVAVGGAAASTIGGLPASPGSGPATQILPTSADGPARCVLAASPRRHGSCRGSNVPGAIAVVAVVAAGVAAYDVRLRRRRPAALGPGGPS
jgi:hypothetical protein